MEKKSSYKKLKEEDIKWEVFRVSGPGGQKVNKTSSGVRLRLFLKESKNFTEEEKESIKKAHSRRINKEGDYIVEASDSRSQKINKKSAMEKAEKEINRAFRPRPARMKTKVPQAQKKERRRIKELISQKKRLRKNLTPLSKIVDAFC